MISLEIASVVVLFATIIILAFRDRKNIEFKYGLLTRRTKRGKKLIYQLAEKHRKILRILGNIGVVVGIGASIYGFSTLFLSSYKTIFRSEEIQQSFAMVLPSVTGVEYPKFAIGVPFWYWIIGVFFVVISHELMHGLLARAEKITIKYLGLALLVVLPGAFVEPDEKQIKKLSTIKKMRIYAGGSFGNFILAALLAIIIFLCLDPIFFRGAVVYSYLNYTSYNLTGPFPAEKLNITGPIISIDGKNVENIENLREIMSSKKPGQAILIKTTKNEYDLKLASDPKNETMGYIGIAVGDSKVLKDEYRNDPILSPVLSRITELFAWVLFLNVGIGTANLLPIKPLDGGLIFEEIANVFFKKKWVSKIVKVVSILTFLLILISLFGPSIISFLR
jgi:membrane-associated protease RseP (regulator of RpoE activity)